ncbi:MAG: nucleotide exchange factor GrpE [Actinomycetes bacterium]
MGDPDRVVIRDKRRLDPESGTVRGSTAAAPGAAAGTDPAGSPPGGSADAGESGSAGETADESAASPADDMDALAAELTADLQRVTAEYANYRRRVERDRVAVVEMATAGLLNELLPVLDDIDRARQHGDLTGAFAAVGERLEQITAKAGLEKYGEPGEPFDPAVHEALMQAEPDPTATVAVCAQVLQPGYRLKSGRVLRPARVSVAEPGAPAAEAAGDEGTTETD